MSHGERAIVYTAPPKVRNTVTRVHCAAGVLEFLIEQIATEPVQADQWTDLRELVAALPLSTAEFGHAINRIQNARAYVEQNEVAAARYELRLLARRLRCFGVESSQA